MILENVYDNNTINDLKDINNDSWVAFTEGPAVIKKLNERNQEAIKGKEAETD